MAVQLQSGQHVIVIGGGIAGLSTAWYLQQRGINYSIVEKTGNWGGKIRTETLDAREGRYILEAGPDSFISQKPWAKQLATEIGFEEQLLGTNDDKRETFILNRGRLRPLPDGVMLIVPTRFLPFAMSPLFSWAGKLRMALESFIPPKTGDEDESLADFVRRRLGSEALDKLAEPLMSGIYNTDAERQSLLATFPRFRTLEKQYGSLTKGMLSSRKSRNKAPAPGTKSSMFTSFKDGMQSFVDALVAKLEGNLLLNTGVQSISQDGQEYRVHLDNGEILPGDRLVFAVPAYSLAGLLDNLVPDLEKQLNTIRYLSTGTLSLAFHRNDVPRPLKGFGLVIPRSEKRAINAITVSSTKFKHRAPENYILMRVFFGGSRTPQTMQLDDSELLEVVRRELHDLTGVKVMPRFSRIYRNYRANPQYDVGHLDRIDSIEKILPENIFVTGSAFRGVGVPDCVNQGRLTAQKIAEKSSVPV